MTKSLYYGIGQVSGNISTDNVAIGDSKPTNMNFVLVDRGADLEGQQSDGIVGLTPQSTDEGQLLVDQLYESGVIEKREFLVYIGKEGVDDSYIDFGKYEGNMTNATVLDVQPYKNTDIYVYWNVTNEGVYYNGSIIDFYTKDTVWDTGTSLLGFPTMDLVNLIEIIANGRDIYYFVDIGMFGYECDSIKDNYDLSFTFGDKNVTVSYNDFLRYEQETCLFYVFDMGAEDFMLLGDSFLRGSKILHDQENKQIVLFEQKIYDLDFTDPELSISKEWIWLLLGCIGALIASLTLNCICKLRSENKLSDYKRVGELSYYP